ncbi:hypothetical protein ABH922_000998 [Rhodococcus sp. 27YEA15]|uniref:hypothetical protein n=1 Tax=Rhodococcus sp. 27YEA15 TaxID=3156259 RepID=UPI003C7C760C
MTYGNDRYDASGHDDYRGNEYQVNEYQGSEYGYYDDADHHEDDRQWLLIRALRALSGTLAAGLVVLTLVVIGSAYLGGARGFPGPGTQSVAVHVVGAVAAVTGQIWCDRRRGLAAVVGSLAVLVIVGAVLATQWWG